MDICGRARMAKGLWPWPSFPLALLALLAPLALLTACGPTTGGTGGGDSTYTLSAFGATSASTCSAPFAESLDCAQVSHGAVGADALPGTTPVYFTGSAATGPYLLTVQGNSLTLQSRCRSTRFQGEFGLLPSGEPRFFGSWVGPDSSAPLAAVLWALSVAGNTEALQVMVFAADATTLFGPLPLSRVPAAPTDLAACP